jgi:TrmH family RNA methyltransferase
MCWLLREMKSHTSNLHNEQMLLALDGVQDPGNLGTIIRLADWYGIRHIIASPCSADFYNPKVLSASMGSFVRVVVHYTELTDFLSKNTGFCVYGTFLQGKKHSPYQTQIAGYHSNGQRGERHRQGTNGHDRRNALPFRGLEMQSH